MTKDNIPLSEDTRKINNATKAYCIKVLRDMAEANPDQCITRNFFRCNSNLAESAWNKHFGTFEEFKRQAGIKLSRHARKMELDVAKHAARESYKLLSAEKVKYAENYLKPNSERYQTMLIGSDVHDVECDPFWKEVFIDTANRIKPNHIVLNGDLYDLPEFGKYSVDPREWDVVARIKWVHSFLKELRQKNDKTEITLIEGNHEFRLLRHLSEATPAMKAILSDLHGFTIPKLLGLDQFEVNYVAPADLSTLTKSDMKAQLRRNYKIFYDFIVAHHFPEGNSFGLPGFNGHHHSHEVRTYFNPTAGAYEWHQMGSGHKREASYCNGEKWSNGFLIAHVDTLEKRVQFEYIDTTHKHCVVGGKWYIRND